jgi:hypothetical protein
MYTKVLQTVLTCSDSAEVDAAVASVHVLPYHPVAHLTAAKEVQRIRASCGSFNLSSRGPSYIAEQCTVASAPGCLRIMLCAGPASHAGRWHYNMHL